MISLGSMRRIPTRWSFLLTIFTTMLAVSAAADTIAPGDKFRDGASLVSAEGRFKLAFFTPGGSKFRYLGIWYNTISVRTVVWVANRDRPVPDSTGVLSFSPNNGRLVLSDANGTVYWSTDEATGLPNPMARLLDNGNFVVTGASGGSYSWQSFDYPTDSMLPGMKLGWDLRAGRSHNITAWRSADDPATGEYAIALDVHGPREFFLVRGRTRLWRSGPWNGQRLTGIPEMKLLSFFSPKFNSNADEVYLWWDTLNSSVVSRMVVQPTGVFERLVWMEAIGVWNVLGYFPKDQCDSVNPCGPFGVCDTNNLAMCSCLQGFDPRSPRDWYLREHKDGCVRRTAMDCRNGTDGFVRVGGAKLPDTSAAVVNQSMALEECPAACLRNCSCTAYATANMTGGGSGCILWGGNLTDLRVFTSGGQDLFIRLAAADLARLQSSSKAQRRPVVAVIVVAAILGVLLVGLMGWWTCLRRRKKRQMAVVSGTTANIRCRRKEESGEGNDLELPLYDFSTIAAATDNFAPQNKLGEGGFGPVYKGRLGGGQAVAVKRLARDSTQGLDEFKNEVMLITKLQHRNLVRLLGCCIHGEERILVYEYLSNKSLDAHVFDKTKAPLLDWQKRYQIIDGVARGLLYLHQDSRLRIIHRDLKASNVLLDKDMNPKISDFGLARIFSRDDTNVNTRRVVGTYGYMSPEYAMDGVFSVKSDVFSFGVLVLEIVSGKRNRGIFLSDPNLSLLGYAWSLWKGGKGLELVDSSLAYSFPVADVLTCIKVGLLCVQERPEDRPTMASVVFMLGGDIASLPQPRQPGFMAIRGPLDGFSSSSTANDVTVTTLDGR